jgi:hypothetical protein
MGLQIESGIGNGYQAEVTNENKLTTYSTVKSEISFESETHGGAYVWTAYQDWGADKNAIWLKNDSITDNLIIEAITVGTPAACVVELWTGNGSTVGGTLVVGTNLNSQSGTAAIATCRHTNTNVDAGAGMTLLYTLLTPASTTIEVNTRGSIILGFNDEIAVNLVTDVSTSAINIIGYYRTK